MVVGAFNNNIKCYELFNVLSLKIFCLKMRFELNRKFTIINKMTVWQTFLVSSMSAHILLYFTYVSYLLNLNSFFLVLYTLFYPPPCSFLNVARY